jgi:hypothetical protein
MFISQAIIGVLVVICLVVALALVTEYAYYKQAKEDETEEEIPDTEKSPGVNNPEDNP